MSSQGQSVEGGVTDLRVRLLRGGVTDLSVRVLRLTCQLRVLKLRVLCEVQTCKVRVADSAPNALHKKGH